MVSNRYDYFVAALACVVDIDTGDDNQYRYYEGDNDYRCNNVELHYCSTLVEEIKKKKRRRKRNKWTK